MVSDSTGRSLAIDTEIADTDDAAGRYGLAANKDALASAALSAEKGTQLPAR